VIGPVLEFPDLQKLSGFDRRADVERWAKDNGVPVKACRGGVWTTLAALNRALGIGSANDDAAPYGADTI
jgi:hypothetical protein